MTETEKNEKIGIVEKTEKNEKSEKSIVTRQEASKPSFWQNALKTIKGDSSENLIEQFTAEMTLVVEGLVEDQSQVNRSVSELKEQINRVDRDHAAERDRDLTDLRSALDALERELDDDRKSVGARLTTIERRLDAFEKKQEAKEKKKPKDSLIRSVTVLAAIVCGSWVLVTILNLFK